MTAATKAKAPARTTQGLRDILFDEIVELRGPESNPSKSLAVANIAKQIVNTAKVELDFARMIAEHEADGTKIELGNMRLGTD